MRVDWGEGRIMEDEKEKKGKRERREHSRTFKNIKFYYAIFGLRGSRDAYFYIPNRGAVLIYISQYGRR